MSDIATGRDADFSEERLIQRYNTDLANSLGNLLNRALNMAAKYREGKMTKISTNPQIAVGMVQDGLGNQIRTANAAVDDAEDSTVAEIPNQIVFGVGCIANNANGLIEAAAPWKLAKDPAQAERLDAVLYTLAESLRIIAILLSPVLPRAAHGIFDQLNWKMELSRAGGTRFRLADAVWGGLPDGHQLGSPTPLFPRIETKPPEAA
jgi:methionyl-tRNA synthetase